MMTSTDPKEVPMYKHLDNSNSFLVGKQSANATAVTPSPSTTWSKLFTEELRDFDKELSSAELPVPALFERLFDAGDFAYAK